MLKDSNNMNAKYVGCAESAKICGFKYARFA
jgi:hypothetical protein